MNSPAEIIRQQVGFGACLMIGAKNFVSTNKGYGLQFKIGRNPKGVTHVKILLLADDTYTMTFSRVYGQKVTTKAISCGVYADMLRGQIEEHTSLLTSM